ncbi:hypothetical protein ABS71_05125 [bacterium SCN 62-11]|nr:MAG: hypothetical protein ABS71_05125 [bacterium SCN 62-11]
MILMQAALAPPEQALVAWLKWRSENSAEAYQYTHNRLLPLISRRLGQSPLTQEDRAFLRGLYRYHWTRNQLLSNCAASILETLENHGVPTLLLKGLALAHLTYRDLGVRPMHDFDVLVAPAQRDRAVAVLEAAGWSYEPPLPALSAAHGCEFRNDKDQRFDLHWFTTDESRWAGADDDFWAGAATLSLGATVTRVLNSTHQLLHVLVHGVKCTGASPCNWVADACAILDSAAVIDWEEFVECARRRRVVLPIALGLRFLKESVGRPVPESVLRELDSTPVNWVDRTYFKSKIRGGTDRLAMLRPFLEYVRNERATGLGSLFGFLRFLRDRWHLQRKRQLPGRIWARLQKRLSGTD